MFQKVQSSSGSLCGNLSMFVKDLVLVTRRLLEMIAAHNGFTCSILNKISKHEVSWCVLCDVCFVVSKLFQTIKEAYTLSISPKKNSLYDFSFGI